MKARVNKYGMWIDMPPEFVAKTRCTTMHVNTRHFYEALADMLEADGRYRHTAMIRDVASHYDSDEHPILFTDKDGKPFRSYLDWDSLSEEEKTNRGKRNAIIRILEQSRSDILLTTDSAENTKWIDDTLRGLTDLFFE